MKLFNAILIGLKDIWAHKFRSLLTMMGIVLGVASLVAMAAIVKGMENGMKESMIAMGGADKVRISDEDVPLHQRHLENQSPGKTMRDVFALQQNASLVELISPQMSLDNDRVSRGGKTLEEWSFRYDGAGNRVFRAGFQYSSNRQTLPFIMTLANIVLNQVKPAMR